MASVGDNLSDVTGLVGYVSKHWRGGFTLGFAYWVNGALLGAVLFLVVYLVSLQIGENAARMGLGAVRLALGAVILGSLAVTVWQLAGIWRSASLHVPRGGKRVWAVLAQVAVVLGAIRTVADLVQEAPTFAMLFGL
jgi:hypothetical protein